MAKKKTANTSKKTALVLSGGGSRGAYQIGAWRALEELGWKFDMVIGVSVGALNGAMVVQGERLLAENLWRELETDSIFDVGANAQLPDFAIEFFRQGGAGTNGLQKFVDNYIDDKKVLSSKIDFGLQVTEFPTAKPHFFWKKNIPNGKVGSYVMASSSAFPALQVYEIDGKKYMDGGYDNVMPIHEAVAKGATDIVAIYLDAAGKFDRKRELDSAENTNLTLVQTKWDLGNFLLFDKKNTSRIIRLGYQDTMKAFNVYDGIYYTFVKGDIEKRQLKGADAAAKVFDLDPLILYSKDLLMEKLIEAINVAEFEFSDIVSAGVSSLRKRNFDFKKAVDMIAGSNKRASTLLIARDLKSKREKSIFLTRPSLHLLGDLVIAARFIQRQGLL